MKRVVVANRRHRPLRMDGVVDSAHSRLVGSTSAAVPCSVRWQVEVIHGTPWPVRPTVGEGDVGGALFHRDTTQRNGGRCRLPGGWDGTEPRAVRPMPAIQAVLRAALAFPGAGVGPSRGHGAVMLGGRADPGLTLYYLRCVECPGVWFFGSLPSRAVCLPGALQGSGGVVGKGGMGGRKRWIGRTYIAFKDCDTGFCGITAVPHTLSFLRFWDLPAGEHTHWDQGNTVLGPFVVKTHRRGRG